MFVRGGREFGVRIRETGPLVALSTICVYACGSGFGMVDVLVERWRSDGVSLVSCCWCGQGTRARRYEKRLREQGYVSC
jgi:Zn ribbon nucleic-acid-binding protein